MKLPRFQFHLSTALVMAIVSGGLIWVNLRTQRNLLDQGHTLHMTGTQGWPFAYHDCLGYFHFQIGGFSEDVYLVQREKIVKEWNDEPTILSRELCSAEVWNYGSLAADFAIAAGIVIGAAFIFEKILAWKNRFR